jgi:hypothetical protein
VVYAEEKWKRCETMKPSKHDALLAFFLTVLTFWIPYLNLFFAIIAIIVGIRAISKINKQPERYGGAIFAYVGVFAGCMVLLATLISYLVGLFA